MGFEFCSTPCTERTGAQPPDNRRTSDATPTAGGDAGLRARNIAVAVRMRPPVGGRSDSEESPWAVNTDPEGNFVLDLYAGQRWSFDHVFGPHTSTSEIFAVCVRDVVRSFCAGINGTVFVYGQTASGKTHTMYGDGESCGVIPESVGELFKELRAKHEEISAYEMSLSYMEIYNEQVTDLLEAEGAPEVKLQDDEHGNLQLKSLQRRQVRCAQEVLGYLTSGETRRHKGETRMNERSSRSHTVLRISLESTVVGVEGVRRHSQLNLVDLAGSEGLKHTAATGERRREGSSINRSLHALSKVIQALAEDVTGHAAQRQAHVAFRDSKLTRLLRPALGGNSHTLVVCTTSPSASNYLETKSTLEFASRAKRVQNKVRVNLCQDGESKIRQLQKELEDLRRRFSSCASASSCDVDEVTAANEGSDVMMCREDERPERLAMRMLELQGLLTAEMRGLMAPQPGAGGPVRRRTLAGPLHGAPLQAALVTAESLEWMAAGHARDGKLTAPACSVVPGNSGREGAASPRASPSGSAGSAEDSGEPWAQPRLRGRAAGAGEAAHPAAKAGRSREASMRAQTAEAVCSDLEARIALARHNVLQAEARRQRAEDLFENFCCVEAKRCEHPEGCRCIHPGRDHSRGAGEETNVEVEVYGERRVPLEAQGVELPMRTRPEPGDHMEEGLLQTADRSTGNKEEYQRLLSAAQDLLRQLRQLVGTVAAVPCSPQGPCRGQLSRWIACTLECLPAAGVAEMDCRGVGREGACPAE